MTKITAICPTLGRPHLLAQAIRQFELQSYQDCRLLILDTGNHIQPQTGDRWEIRQLGRVDTAFWATMNELVRMTDSPYVCKLDDDDIYAPWHLAAHVDALDRGWWSAPSIVYDSANAQADAPLVKTRTCRRADWRDLNFAGCWGYRREAFEVVGGFPPHGLNEGEVEFSQALYAAFGPPEDTISERFPEPSYAYRRGRSWQASLLQNSPEETMRLRTMKREPVGTIVPTWPELYFGLSGDPQVYERPW